MNGSIIDIFYSDYREINGIKLPFKTVSEADNQTILTITFNKVTLNKPVADNSAYAWQQEKNRNAFCSLIAN